MNETDRLARAAQLYEEALRIIREESERQEIEAARDCCDQCPHPKSLCDETLSLPNGVRLSVYVAHCQEPTADCTALAYSHLLSEPPPVANRIVEWLVAQPEMQIAGVSWMGCLAPGAERIALTYRVPVAQQVAAAVGAVNVEEFRAEPPGPNCAQCGQPIPRARLQSIPKATRCLDCQIAAEQQ